MKPQPPERGILRDSSSSSGQNQNTPNPVPKTYPKGGKV